MGKVRLGLELFEAKVADHLQHEAGHHHPKPNQRQEVPMMLKRWVVLVMPAIEERLLEAPSGPRERKEDQHGVGQAIEEHGTGQENAVGDQEGHHDAEQHQRHLLVLGRQGGGHQHHPQQVGVEEEQVVQVELPGVVEEVVEEHGRA
ncbi:hypothetical protein QOT17_010022 [Balamuthia mandrillaris]